MKRHKKIKLLMIGFTIIFIFGVIVSFSFNRVYNPMDMEENLYPKLKNSTYSIIGGIYIDNSNPLDDWVTIESTYDWCSGSGTSNEPYIIKNVIVSGTGSGRCIYIANSEEYFMIVNCTLANNSYGISLHNTSNGIATLNTIYSNNVSGIYTSESEFNLITLNSIFNNSIWGIDLTSSNNTLIVNNSIYNSEFGIRMIGYRNEIVYNFINDTANVGIQLVNSFGARISGNFIYNHTNYAIAINQSQGNSIVHNTVNNNTKGIILYESNLNIISCNNITTNKFYGIFFDNFTHFNIVSWNNFIENCYDPSSMATSQCYDWDSESGNNFHHNYWDDWEGSGDYSIDGPSSTFTNQDFNPLDSPTDVYNCPPPGEHIVGSPILGFIAIIAILSSSVIIYAILRKKIATI